MKKRKGAPHSTPFNWYKDIKKFLNKEIDLGDFFIIWWIVIWSLFFLILTAL